MTTHITDFLYAFVHVPPTLLWLVNTRSRYADWITGKSLTRQWARKQAVATNQS